jgi:TetR/AcrR family transcriptional repressor of bet genes
LPKLGMGPIRREQICRAAAAVIAREGFAGTTMRLVAEEAAVSTGMLNHYFVNREDLLTKSLVFVSERAMTRLDAAIEELAPGRSRLAALLDSLLSDEDEVSELWRIWINSYGEAVRLPALRQQIDAQLARWFALVDRALEGLVPADEPSALPWSWRLDALLNGLTIRSMTSDTTLKRTQIRDGVMQALLGDFTGSLAGA